MGDTRTVIGAATRISGQLEGDEDLTIQGRVDGKIRLTRTLTVEPAGVVVADVDVKDLVVSGVLVGNVTASDSVHLTERGRMVGDINAPRVIIVAGASFRGRVDMGDMDGARAERSAPARRENPAVSSAAALRPAARVEARNAPRPPAAPQRPAIVAAPRPPAPPAKVASGSAAPRPPSAPAPNPSPRAAEPPRVAAGNASAIAGTAAAASPAASWAKKKLKRR